MVSIQDQVMQVSIALTPQYASAAFSGNASYPSTAVINSTVTITYPTVVNVGDGAGVLYGYLYDLTYNTIVAGTQWQTATAVPVGGVVTPTPTASIILSEPFSGQLVIGHIQ